MDVAIVGCGKLGGTVAEALADGDYQITLIDKNDETLERLSQQLDVMTINEDGRKISVYEELGIEDFEFLLAATDSDEKNITIASFAKKLGCKHVIARVRDPEHMNQFDFIKEAMDIDNIVNPDMSITVEIYKYLVEKYTLGNGMFTSGKVALTEFSADKFASLIGLSMEDVRDVMPNILVAAISRNGKVILPRQNDVIEDNDYIYVLGKKEEISKLHLKVHSKEKQDKLNNVMIIGGGKTGYYLAQKLEEYGTSVKIVERDLDRCRYLSTNLSNVMVLHGEGTDIDLLEEENMDSMDAFITATGYDEENLLLALTAKHHGLSDVISKVSHENYQDLISQMGVDMVLNPLDITTSNILRYIQGSNTIISSALIQGQAEISEVIVNSKMKMLGSKIGALDLPDDVLIAAIHRGRDLIIPDSDTEIKLNDRVIILNLLTGMGDIEKLMRSKLA